MSIKFIYVDANSTPKRIVVEENETFTVYNDLFIEGPSKLVCGKRIGFKKVETSVWIETEAEVNGQRAENQSIEHLRNK